MNTQIPEEFKSKDREELYMDIIMLSNYINKLKIEVDDLKAQLHLKNGEIVKKRTDNFLLKSELGAQAITLNQIKEDNNNIIDLGNIE